MTARRGLGERLGLRPLSDIGESGGGNVILPQLLLLVPLPLPLLWARILGEGAESGGRRLRLFGWLRTGAR
jgi:hypothetical protein